MTPKMAGKNSDDPLRSRTLRINMSMRGPLAEFAYEQRQKGHVRSVPDLVSQALRALQDQVMERELAKARLDAIKNTRQDPE